MSFLNIFKKTEVNTLDNIKVEDLTSQLKTLDINERTLNKQLSDANARQAKVIEDYKRARTENNEVQAKFLSRQFESIEPEIKALQSRHASLTKQKRVIHGLKLMKENADFLTKIGDGVLSKMNIADLQGVIEKATAEGELNEERLNDVVATLDISLSHADTSQDDGLLEKMDKIAFGNDNSINDVVSEGLSKIDSALAQLDTAATPSEKKKNNNDV